LGVDVASMVANPFYAINIDEGLAAGRPLAENTSNYLTLAYG